MELIKHHKLCLNKFELEILDELYLRLKTNYNNHLRLNHFTLHKQITHTTVLASR